MKQVYCLGSLNRDYVYRVATIAGPGETVASYDFSEFIGGKGANQSLALARAGAVVRHCGCIGADGTALVRQLNDAGVDAQFVRTVQAATGHAFIQVAVSGENAIIVQAGANACITEAQLKQALALCAPGDIFLTQNETNLVPEAIALAAERHLEVWFNPAPCDPAIGSQTFAQVHTLVLNAGEAAYYAQVEASASPGRMLEHLHQRWPHLRVILTAGKDGAYALAAGQQFHCPAVPTEVVDTTGAGDTFIGYCLAAVCAGLPFKQAIAHGCLAASKAVAKAGASSSIPFQYEL